MAACINATSRLALRPGRGAAFTPPPRSRRRRVHAAATLTTLAHGIQRLSRSRIHDNHPGRPTGSCANCHASLAYAPEAIAVPPDTAFNRARHEGFLNPPYLRPE